MPDDTSVLVRDARLRAGLTQRELARRAETAQSVVARIERRQTSPTWETLTRLLSAAGFDLDASLAVRPVFGSHMLDDVARILCLTPDVRLADGAHANRVCAGARRAA